VAPADGLDLGAQPLDRRGWASSWARDAALGVTLDASVERLVGLDGGIDGVRVLQLTGADVDTQLGGIGNGVDAGTTWATPGVGG
jgi:hypothetical protein